MGAKIEIIDNSPIGSIFSISFQESLILENQNSDIIPKKPTKSFPYFLTQKYQKQIIKMPTHRNEIELKQNYYQIEPSKSLKYCKSISFFEKNENDAIEPKFVKEKVEKKLLKILTYKLSENIISEINENTLNLVHQESIKIEKNNFLTSITTMKDLSNDDTLRIEPFLQSKVKNNMEENYNEFDNIKISL